MKKKLKADADSLSIQKQDLLKEYDKVKKLNILNKTKKELLVCLKTHATQRQSENDFEYKKRLFREFINCVYVWDDKKYMIFYNLIGDSKPTLDKTLDLIKSSGYDINKLKKGSSNVKRSGVPTRIMYEPKVKLYYKGLFGMLLTKK